VQITIRLFARLRDIAGAADLVRDMPEDATVETAWQALAAEFPPMAPHRVSLSAAVNAEYARFTRALADRDEVVFLPPVSGG
jgi:molybdopterin synthase sulfur carrier subunit